MLIELRKRKKMPERQKAVIVNGAILAGLAWSYFKGDPLSAILITGILLLAVANGLMYAKRRRIRSAR